MPSLTQPHGRTYIHRGSYGAIGSRKYKRRKRAERPALFRLLSILTYYADDDSICHRSLGQIERDTGIRHEYLANLFAELAAHGKIEILDWLEFRVSRCRILQPFGPRRSDVSPETDSLIDTIRVWTKQCELMPFENAALRAVALALPEGQRRRAATMEDIARMGGFSTSSSGVSAAMRSVLLKLGKRRFIRIRRGGNRRQLGGGYSTEKNLYEFVALASDPDRLKPHLIPPLFPLSREAESAPEERERLLTVILRQPKDMEGWRWVFLQVLQEGVSLGRQPVKYRLHQMEKAGDIKLRPPIRNKNHGPYGAKGVWGATGILVTPRTAFPRRAQWFETECKKRKLSLRKFCAEPEAPAKNTLIKMKRGQPVSEDSLEKICRVLSNYGRPRIPVRFEEIPPN